MGTVRLILKAPHLDGLADTRLDRRCVLEPLVSTHFYTNEVKVVLSLATWSGAGVAKHNADTISPLVNGDQGTLTFSLRATLCSSALAEELTQETGTYGHTGLVHGLLNLIIRYEGRDRVDDDHINCVVLDGLEHQLQGCLHLVSLDHP